MKKLLTLSLLVLTMLSCSQDSEQIEPSISQRSVTFRSDIATRVDFGGFELGDTISVAAYCEDRALTTNMHYGYDGYIFNSETPIEYENALQELVFTAVYPAREESIVKFDFEIAADQTVDDAYELSDLLVSESEPTSERQPELLFNHAMSNVVINIISDESFADAVLTLKAVNNATCDLSAKTYVAKGDATTITATKNADLGLKAIVAPQIIAANTTFATLTVGDRVYEWTTLEEMSFESGRQYSFNWDLEINEVAPTGIINGWGDSNSEAGTDIAYTRLKDYSATSYPKDAETWVIYDVYASTANFGGLRSALNAISCSVIDEREISIEFPNLLVVPESAINSHGGKTIATCLKRVSLPNVTMIQDDAFYLCEALESIYTPKLTTIGSCVFEGCERLSSINVSKVTNIGSSAFHGCNSILSLTFDSLVHVGGGAFAYMSNLVSLSLPKAEVIYGGAFSKCENLFILEIPNVYRLEGRSIFEDCFTLEALSIPKFTTWVTSSPGSDYIFDGCYRLRHITLATESTIDSCYNFFKGCSVHLITLSTGDENAAYVNGNIFTTFDTSGDVKDYTFYEIKLVD